MLSGSESVDASSAAINFFSLRNSTVCDTVVNVYSVVYCSVYYYAFVIIAEQGIL